jgi:phosphatidylglycerophosphatase A
MAAEQRARARDVDGLAAAALPRAAGKPANRLAWLLSLWFGCGRVPYAPGTAGTLGAFPIYWLTRPHGLFALTLAALTIAVAGIWASSRVAAETGTKDPQFVVVDEVAGVLVTWLAAPPTWQGVAIGFVLFRIFDWKKPFPARALERLPGGFGIVLDDLAAGAWGALALVVARAAGLI